MANVRWESGAAPVAKVVTFAFGGTWEIDDVVRVIAGNKQKDLTPASTVTSTVVSALDALIDALDSTVYPEINSTQSGVIASSATTTLTLTAQTAGVDFTVSLTPLEVTLGGADTQTIEGAGVATTGTIATANAGPAVYGTARNWDGGAKPVAGDVLFIDNSASDILYDLSQAGATLTAGYIAQSFEGTIGLPIQNTLGTEYPEYRTEYLTIDCTTWHIGFGPGSGSGRIKLNSGTVQTAVNVYNTGTPLESSLEAFLWKGTHASNVFSARGSASCGIAVFGGESAVVATLNVEEEASVRCGDNVTLTTVNALGIGTVEINSNVGGTLTNNGCEVSINKTATAAQLTLRGGTTYYNGTGTISGNTIVSGNAVLDFSKGIGAVTVTNPIELYGPNARIIDPDKRVVALIVDYNEGASEGQVEWGKNIRLTRGTPA